MTYTHTGVGSGVVFRPLSTTALVIRTLRCSEWRAPRSDNNIASLESYAQL